MKKKLFNEMIEDNSEDIFSKDLAPDKNQGSSVSEKWKILIVDDEKDVHSVTKLAMHSFSFGEKEVEFIDAYSAKEALEVLENNKDIAVVLLDVVMESNTAGLQLIEDIRNKLNNKFVRIVLRTGQPGEAPENSVIQNYEIDDYKTKTELTKDKLFTVVTASLRTYEAMSKLQFYSEVLEKRVNDRTAELNKSLEQLKESQEKRLKLERENSVLAMAVTANHELNQPMMVIKGNAEMLQDSFKPNTLNEKQVKFLTQIQKSIDRMSSILFKYKKSKSISFHKYAPKTDMVIFDEESEN